jgi:Cu(I)/Ag(I) efflux system membrane fusion protein
MGTRKSKWLGWLAVLAVTAVLGGGLGYSYNQGWLTSASHRLTQGHAGATEHGGMGMNMPGMSMGSPQGGGATRSSVPGHALVTISAEGQQLIGVRFGKVRRDKLRMTIRPVGILEPDQTRLTRVHTRISGWVTKVHVNFVGENVRKGDPLLEIYSPDLLTTQEEYLAAVEHDGPRSNMAQLARRRLKLWDIPDDEITRLEKTRQARDTLTLRATLTGQVLSRDVLEGAYVEPKTELYRLADLSVVWVQAKVYEYELPHVHVNQPARVALLSEPETWIDGRISFIEPWVQEASRTVKVRVAIPNPRLRLKPGMYANVRIEHDMGEGLLVPEDAVLRTGERDLAFRALPGGRFEPVAVTLGPRFGDQFQVVAGLAEGEEIVTSAVFLIDSESRLKSAVGGAGGHQHGSMSGSPAAPPPHPNPLPPGGRGQGEGVGPPAHPGHEQGMKHESPGHEEHHRHP